MTQKYEEKIKAEAIRLGFAVCGIAEADEVPNDVYSAYLSALSRGYQGTMSYLERNEHLRRDPRLLMEGCRSVIMVAMNYYPNSFQEDHLPQFAYYAYGRDYHKVLKKRLDALLKFIQEHIDPSTYGRSFTDSAPILERYWAQQAGLGWLGKHGLLIVPQSGSYFFLGCLLVSLPLRADQPQPNRCGSCTRCLDGCPTKALIAPGLMDARRCISYLTIESQENIPKHLASLMLGKIYGCDDCQKVCPWNNCSKGTTIEDFALRPILRDLSYEAIEQMTQTDFDTAFAGSAIRRISLQKLQATAQSIRPNTPKPLE